MNESRAPYRVLLIEEDPKETELYSDLIREVSQCQVDLISRMESSFEWLARSNYNLVVIDASARKGSPAVDALALLEQIKRLSPVTGVIIVSEQATVEAAVAAIRMGAEDYLKKPFNLEAFQLAVKRGLDRKTVFGEDYGGVNGFFDLLSACQMISASLDRRKIFGIVQSYLARELESDHTAIYALTEVKKEGVPTVTKVTRIETGRHGQQPDRAMEEVLDISLQASNPLPKMTESGELFRFIERGQLTPGLFLFRFKCASNMDYFCVCLSPKHPASIESFESRLRMVKAQIEVTGKNIEQYLGVQQLAYMDDATGLYNTRYLNYILDREIAQAKVSDRSFAVLFIDADRFKSINDSHGHLVGTKLLNELGHLLKKLVRDTDTVFRYGGDEFVAVLSPCDLPTAKAVAERIRASVEQRKFLRSENLGVHFTVSIGVALFPDHAKTKRAIIDAADRAMYDAKRIARNSVTIAGTLVDPAVKQPG